MIITRIEFLERAMIDGATLDVWLEEEWLIPQTPTSPDVFSDVDLARARLIRDLMRDFGVNREAVGVILHLVDQLHGLRQALASAFERRDSGSDAAKKG